MSLNPSLKKTTNKRFLQVTAPTTSYQQNLSVPSQQDKWYAGNEPTTMEVYGRIGQLLQTDPNQAYEMYTDFRNLQNTPGNSFYTPYNQVTNRAVSNLAAYGIDVSNINDDWYKQNNFLTQYLNYDGTTNTPTKPGSKASAAEKAAYEYYQVWKAEENTKRAEQQWQALQEEIYGWVNMYGRNYTNEEILNKIDWSKYSELTSMDDPQKNAMQPNEYNRVIGYSKDALQGVLWAARNPKADGTYGTGDTEVDMVYSAMGMGNRYVENPELRAMLDPQNEAYNPYAAGSTMERARIYFNRNYFDQKWLDKNIDMKYSQDETKKAMYKSVEAAEAYTQTLEGQLSAMETEINTWLKYVDDPQQIIDAIYSNNDYKDLFDLDKTIAKGELEETVLKATTRAVNYRRADIEKVIHDACDAKKNANLPSQDTDDSIEMLTGTRPENNTTNEALEAQRIANLNGAGLSIMQHGTKTEKEAYVASNGGAAGAFIDMLGGVAIDITKSLGMVTDVCNDLLKLDFSDAKVSANYRLKKDQRDRAIYEQYGYMNQLSELSERLQNGETLTAEEEQIYNELSERNRVLNHEIMETQEYMDLHADDVRKAKQNNSKTAENISLGSYLSDTDKALEEYGRSVVENRKNWLRNMDSSLLEDYELDDQYAIFADDMNKAKDLLKSQEGETNVETYGNAINLITNGEFDGVSDFDLLSEDEYNALDNEEKGRVDELYSRASELYNFINGLYEEGRDVHDPEYYKDIYRIATGVSGVDSPYMFMPIEEREKVDELVKKAIDSFYSGNPKADIKAANDKLWEIKGIKETRRKIADFEANATGDTSFHPELVAGIGIKYWSNDASTEDVNGVYSEANNANDSGLFNTNARFMTDKQRDTFNSYYNAGEYEKAQEYYDLIKPSLEEQRIENRNKIMTDAASGDFGFLVGLASVPLNVVAGIEGSVAIIASFFGNKDAQNVNSYIYDIGRDVSTIRDTRLELFDDTLVNWFGEGAKGTGKFFGGVYYSIMDNLMSMGAAGGFAGAKNISQGMVQILMSSQAASSAMLQNLESGMDVTEAAIRAIGSGVIEAVTEKYSLEALLNMDFDSIKKFSKQMIPFLAKNTLTEASEEGASEILDLLMDVAVSAIAGHDNEIEAQIKKLMADNPDMSLDQAEAKVWSEWFSNTLTAMASGGVSGFAMSGGRSILNAIGFAKTGSKNRGSVDSILTDAFQYGEGSDLAAFAKEVQDDIAAGKRVSNLRIGQLKNGTDLAIAGEERRGELDSMLKLAGKLDEDTDPHKLANELNEKIARGETVSNYEIGKLAYALYGDKILKTETKEEAKTEAVPEEIAPLGEITENDTDPELTKELTLLFKSATNGDNQAQGAVNTATVLSSVVGKDQAVAAGTKLVTDVSNGDAHTAAITVAGLFRAATAVATTNNAETGSKSAVETAAKDVAKTSTSLSEKLGWTVKDAESEIYEDYSRVNAIYDENGNRIGIVNNNGDISISPKFKDKYDAALQNAGFTRIRQGWFEAPSAEIESKASTTNDVKDAIASVKQIVSFASLTNGDSNTVLKGIAQKVANHQEVTQQDLSDLITAAETDMNGENSAQLNAQLQNSVYEIMVAMEGDRIIAERGVNPSVRKAEQSVLTAKSAYAAAAAQQQRAQANAEAAANNLKAAEAEYDPSPDRQETAATLEQSTNRMAGAVAQKNQADQTVANAEQNVAKAEKEAEWISVNELNNVRQEAAANVQQRQEQEAQAKAQAEAEAEQARHEAAQAQAEADEKSGKSWEDLRDNVVEEILNNEYLEEGERREARRKELTERANMIREGRLDMAGMMNNPEGLLAVGILGRQLGVEVAFTDDPEILPKGAAGKYKDGVIYLNKNMIQEGKMTVGQAVMEIALHEFTHYMEGTKAYAKYSKTVLDFLFQGNDARMRAAIDSKIADYQEKFGRTLTEEGAKAEIVADFAKTRLNERDMINRFIQEGVAGKIRNALHNINQAIKNFRLTGVERETAEYLRKTERLYTKMIEQAAKSSTHPDGDQFSIAQLAEATGLEFNENTLEIRTPDGSLVDGVNNKITPEMLNGTPVGMLIDLAQNGMKNKKGKSVLNPTITSETAAAQKKMFSDLANMAAQYRDSDLVWEIASSTLFSAMKSNSDPQYSTTIDFGTICAKTQEIINVMSRVMLEKGRGLTREEVLKVYNETAKADLTVPCPVCYVFSRWMGVPSLLGQMSQYQKQFVKLNSDGSINVPETQKAANEYIQSALSKYGDKETIDKAKVSITNRLKTQENNRTEALKVLASETATEKEKAAAQAKHDKAIETMDNLTKELGEVEAFNWVTQALCKQERKGKQIYNVLDKNGNYVVDSAFQLTPDEVLFDLRRTGDFAKYTKNWSYRNTCGAGTGKAIMPYSGMSIGDVIYGTNRKLASANPFLVQDPQTAAKGVNDAIARAVKQNLIGGQRLQSTSDFRPEWGLDYLMTFLELQAIGSKVQMYTKVAESVPLLASMGADINLSIMGKGQGWHVDKNGNYVLDFSDVTGMNYDTAKALKDQHDNIQMILVGMNDTHIRLALADSDIDFVIPWHASGNSKDTLSSLVSSASVGKEQLETSSDYTDTQNDKASDNQTDEQKELWNLRMKILQGKKINAQEREIIYQDKYLSSLYDRFNVEGVDADCYKVKLAKDQAKQIFPYEYWDKSLTKDQADENGRRFVEYCLHFGITPRFSGTVKNNEDGTFDVTGNFAGAIYDENGNITGYDPEQMYKGYWKVLIDRPMYDNAGNYRDQQVVDVTKAKIGKIENGKLVGSDMPLTTSAMYGPNYSEQEKNAVDNALAAINEQNDLAGEQFSDAGASLADLGYTDQQIQAEQDQYPSSIIKISLEHTPAQAETIIEYLDAVNHDILNMATALRKNKHQYIKPMSIGRVTDAEANDIKNITGVDVSNYKHEINKDFFLHTEKKHGNGNHVQDRTMADLNDVARVEWSLRNYDEIIIDPGTKKSGMGYKNSDNTRAVNIAYVKHIDGTMYVTEAVADSNSKTLRLIGAYIDKNDSVINSQNQAASYVSDANAPDLTSDNVHTTPSNGMVAQNNDEVNDQLSDGSVSLTDLDQTLVDSGIITQEDLDAYYGQAGNAQRQFGQQTSQTSDDLSDRTKEYLYTHSAYTPDTNKEQIDRASDWVKSMATENDPDGYQATVNEVTKDDFDYRSADGQARMITVMSMAASRGDTATELRIADAYNGQGTDIARALQARKLFRLMDPIGRRMALQQEVSRINQEYKNANKDTEVGLSEATLKAAEVAETEEEFAQVQKQAMKELAEQMPANWKEKLRTWRMVSMLANPRTHIRNILGNWIFKPVVSIKNAIGAGLESKFVKGDGERTKAIRYTDDAKAFAKQDVEAMRDVLTGEAKYSPESKIEQNKKVFGQGKGILSKTIGKAVQTISDVNSNLLEAEDWMFLNKHYQNALASYMTANNLKSEDMTGDTLERAREYAILEAQKATYRDANAVSSWLNKASRRGGIGGFLVDTVLPFKKTPANILRRGIEYSPVGLISSLATAKRSVDLYAAWDSNGRKGKMPKGAKSLTQVLDGIASGLTGTAIAGLGALAYALGYIKLDLGDDEEFEKERGSQEYSIEVFGHSFTIDWAAPVCMPFFTGAALYKEIADRAGGIEDADDAAKLLGSIINGLSGITEPVFNLSMLEGVSSLLKSASYSSTDRVPIFELAQNIGANYVGSLVPSALGAVARTIDTTRRQNYVESGDPLRIWKQKIEQAQNKIPFLSMYNIPYRDVYGNTDTSSVFEAFLENFVLPGYLNEMKEDKTIDELERILDAGETSVIPSTANKKIGDVALTDQQYDQYRVTRGQTAKSMLDELVNSDEFAALADNPEAQAELVSKIWKYANAVARKELFPDYDMKNLDNWIKKGYANGNPIDALLQSEEQKAKNAYIEEATNSLYLAIDQQDAEAVNTSLEALKKTGKENKNIRTTLMNHYRPLYKQAILDGDTDTANAIKYGMMMLNLGDQSFRQKTFTDWARDAINGVAEDSNE